MKSQMDWIISGVAIVLALVAAVCLMETKPVFTPPASVTKSNVDSDLIDPVENPVISTSLPGGNPRPGGGGKGGGGKLGASGKFGVSLPSKKAAGAATGASKSTGSPKG
jgi:hypothetical protein